jgi:hypothetical protein
MDKKIVVGIVLGILSLLGGTIFLATKVSSSAEVEMARGAKVELNETAWEWGEIGINDGKVEKEFEIKNTGSEVLKIYNIATSCMCTSAMFTDDTSHVFGMHTKSGYVKEVPAGESTKIKVVFDPLFHGPDGVGPIGRQVTMMTNDADNGSLSFMLTATVRR